jgi:hypothetical protein
MPGFSFTLRRTKHYIISGLSTAAQVADDQAAISECMTAVAEDLTVVADECLTAVARQIILLLSQRI